MHYKKIEISNGEVSVLIGEETSKLQLNKLKYFPAFLMEVKKHKPAYRNEGKPSIIRIIKDKDYRVDYVSFDNNANFSVRPVDLNTKVLGILLNEISYALEGKEYDAKDYGKTETTENHTEANTEATTETTTETNN